MGGNWVSLYWNPIFLYNKTGWYSHPRWIYPSTWVEPPLINRSLFSTKNVWWLQIATQETASPTKAQPSGRPSAWGVKASSHNTVDVAKVILMISTYFTFSNISRIWYHGFWGLLPLLPWTLQVKSMHRYLSSGPTVVHHCRAGIPPASGQFSLRNLTIQAFFGSFANIAKNSKWSNHLHITCRIVLTMTVGRGSYLPTSISPWEMVSGLAIRWQAQLLIDGSLVALHILLLDHYAAGCEASCPCHVSFTLKGIQILAVLVFTTERLANPQIMWQRTFPKKIIKSSSKQQKTTTSTAW